MLNTTKTLMLNQLRRRGYRLVTIRDAFKEQRRLLNDSRARVIVDIGANRGETVATYRRLFPDATIYAFEPFPDHAARLRHRFREDHRVHVVESAVAAERGRRILNVSGGHSTHSLLGRPPARSGYLPERAIVREQIEVDVITLDEFCRLRGISCIDVLKIDVEGSELQVLQGSCQLLKQDAVPLLLLEVMFVPHYANQPLYFELARFLDAYGYSLYDIYDLKRSHHNGQLRFANALFVSPQFRNQKLETARCSGATA